MRPYHIAVEPGGTWIDLDHILAISDLVVGDLASPRGNFSITMAFRDQPIVISVHDRSTIDGYNEVTQQMTISITFADPEEVDQLQVEYEKLLSVWTGTVTK